MTEEIVSTEELETPASIITEEPAKDDKVVVDGEDKDGQADDDTPAVAPETYEDFVLPEEVSVNEDLITEFSGLAKEANMPQDMAQKFVTLQAEYMGKMAAEAATAQEEAWGTTLSEWADAAKADKEIGGADFKANVGVMRKALDMYGTPELKEALDITGVGNHPEFLRLMYRMGKDISDDKIVAGQGGPVKAAPKTLAARIFDNDK